MARRPAPDLPRLTFTISRDHNLYWHLIAKYGDVVPVNQILMSAVSQKYRIENAPSRDPSVVQLLRELAYRADDWAVFESTICASQTLEKGGLARSYETYFRTLREGMRIEMEHYRTAFDEKKADLQGFHDYLTRIWKTHGAFALNELSTLTGAHWPSEEIRVNIVGDSLYTGLFRRDFLVLPHSGNNDQGLCVLLHLLTRYLITQKVLDVMSQFTGPSQELYLDAIYGLLVNHILSQVTREWRGFGAPIEPRGGQEYKIFLCLLPHWRDHLNRKDESFDEFVKRRIGADFIPTRRVAELIKHPNLVAR